MRGLPRVDLKQLAGARSYECGLGYLDAVSRVEAGGSSVTATAHGAERYEVLLPLDGPGGPAGECDAAW